MSAKITPKNSTKPYRRKSADLREHRTESPSSAFPEMKRTHKIVLDALEIANLALKRVVTTKEVIKALSRNEVEELHASYAKNIDESVSVILGLLIRRGSVFSPGKTGTRRYYGSGKILDPSVSPLPNIKSRRQRVHDLLLQL